MTDAHTPRLLSDADAAADLAGVARPGQSMANYTFTIVADSGYESTTEGRCSAKQYGAVIYALHNDDSYAEQRDSLVSERDALAGRVRELEAERDAALADSERRHTLLKMQHAESVELYNALSDLSFECDGVTCVLPPSRETYNRTFMVLKMKPHLSPAALRGHGESGAALTTPESKP